MLTVLLIWSITFKVISVDINLLVSVTGGPDPGAEKVTLSAADIETVQIQVLDFCFLYIHLSNVNESLKNVHMFVLFTCH